MSSCCARRKDFRKTIWSVCSLRSTRSSAMCSRLRRGRSRLRQVAACASCGRMTPFARCWIALTLPCTGRRKAAEGGLSARACGAPSRCAVDFAIRRSAVEPLVEGTRAIRRSGRSRQGSARCHPERNDRRTVPSWRRSTSASKVEASRTRVIRVGFVSAACGNRVGAAWERRWIQGESALDPCHLRVRSRRYH